MREMKEVVLGVVGVLSAVALAGGRTASAVWTYKAPSFFVEGAISAADRAVWRKEVPGRLATAEARLREVKRKIPAAFAGMEGTFQFERLTRRAELAGRLLAFIGWQLEEVDDEALAYAMLGLRDFDLFTEYAEREFACRHVYPLAPGVEHEELNVRDFGAKGDGQTSDSDAFARALEAVRALKGRPCVLKVPAGSYRLARRMTFARPVKHPLTGEETGFAREEDTHLNVVALRNFVLSGEDPQTTELVFDDYDTRGLSFFCCENATLRNIQLRWARTPFSQTTVLEVNRAENWAIVRHDPGTLRPDDACFRRTGISQICAQFDPKTHHENLVGNPFFDPRLGVDDLGEGRFRIRFDPTKCPLSTDWIKVEVGAKLILPDRKNNLHAAGCPRSALCNFENVWVRNSREAGIMPAGGWMITASRCRTFPYRDDLYLSTNADSFFNWRGSHLSGCFFHCMNDDGCNSYSRGALIAAVRPPDVLLVHGIAGRRRPGDLVQVIRPTDGRCMYLGRIREVGREKGEFLLRMETPVPTSLRTQETQHEKDMTAEQRTEIHHGVKAYENSPDILFLPHGAGFGYLCLNNDIGDLRNVGCQVQCPNTLVEGNRFSYVHTALELSSLLQWQEGTPPYDILYRNNVIEHVGTGFGCGVGLMRGHQCVCSPLRGIAIVSNRFDDVRGVPLRIRNARDVQVFGNTFTNCPVKPLVQFSRSVRIHENEGLVDLPSGGCRRGTPR